MPINLEYVPLEYMDRQVATATAYGNNAAWLCRCGHELPLLTNSDVEDGEIDVKVQCPGCKAMYSVIAESRLGVVEKVKEVERVISR